MSIREEQCKAYVILQDNCGIAVGDEVKVLRTASSGENGWNPSWIHSMDSTVGKTYKVLEIAENSGIRLDNGTYACWYPFFVLGLVKKGKPPFEPLYIPLNSEYSATVSEHNVKVGCQYFTFAAIKSLALAVKKAQEYNRGN